MTHRRPATVDVEDIIRAHQPGDTDGLCVACKAEGYRETYPCWPLLLADRLAERAARRTDRPGGEQAERTTVNTHTTGTDPSLAEVKFVKSTFSSGNTDNCVAVGVLPDGSRAVRHSKGDAGDPILIYTAAEWDAFRLGMEAGEF